MKDMQKFFVDITNRTSKLSTCSRKQLGALLVKDKRIISIGYNGVASGQEHCKDHFEKWKVYYSEKNFYDYHGIFSNENEIHAETNCIGYASREGISTKDCTIYVSLSPCTSCAKLIIAAGIKEVFYLELYDRDQLGIKLLDKVGIKCEMVK